MFSLDAMTRGQHAISTATSQTSVAGSGASTDRTSSSPLTYGTWGRPRTPASRTVSRSRSLSRLSSRRRRGGNKLDGPVATGALVQTHRPAGPDVEENSISLYHAIGPSAADLEEPSRAHLKDFHRVHLVSFKEATEELDVGSRREAGGLGDGPPPAGPLAPTSAGRFRYVVASLIILSVTVCAYASNTMYIAAIEMISNDVLQSGLTSLRAKHLSNDPLAVNKNAALPGTCPKEAVRPSQAARLVSALNASVLSAHEQLAMQQDSQALYKSVHERLADGGLVDWTISQRGYIFTAHTVGQILITVPVGRLGLCYGSYRIVLVCVLLASLRMFALPALAGRAPFWATFLFELLIGGVGGNISILGYPLAAAWLLPYEANFFVALNVLATLVGIAATNFVSTQLLAAGVDWCWCYYLPACMLLLLSLAWFVWGADRPGVSSFVSPAELLLLQSDTLAMRNETALKRNEHQRTARKSARANESNNHAEQLEREQQLTRLLGGEPQQPQRHDKHLCRCASQWERDSCPAQTLVRRPNWSTIFTCRTVWAIILVQFAGHWTSKNATLWPTFFSNILHLDSSTIGILLGIKGVFALVFGSIFALATRKLVDRRPFNMSLTAYRRWNQAIGASVYALAVLLMVFLDCNLLANCTALLLQPVVSSFNSISHDQMPLDLSAEDSGLLMSVIRMFAIGDVVALPVASFMLSHAPDALAGDRRTWQLVWSGGMAIRLLASFYFILVAKSEPKLYSRLEPAGACKSRATPASTGAYHQQ